MAKLALERMFDNTDSLLARTENPLHRKILINWRRHSCLEIMGRYQEIFAPDLTVPHPVYHVHTDDSGTVVLDGRAAVEGFYRELTESGASVMVGLDDHIAVNDWGFTIESDFHNFVPGAVLALMGMDVDDQEATYVINYQQAMVWHYTDDGLLIGENIYGGTRTITKPDSEDVITLTEAVEILTPILAATPQS